MFEYTKAILKKVSFNQDLFDKQLKIDEFRLTRIEFNEIKRIFKIE